MKDGKYLRLTISKLVHKFYASSELIEQDKMNQILQTLCGKIQPEIVFIEFSKTISEECEDFDFMSDLILELTMTVASSNVEKKLRRKLRKEIPTEYSKDA